MHSIPVSEIRLTDFRGLSPAAPFSCKLLDFSFMAETNPLCMYTVFCTHSSAVRHLCWFNTSAIVKKSCNKH